jgi:hypothetical protein
MENAGRQLHGPCLKIPVPWQGSLIPRCLTRAQLVLGLLGHDATQEPRLLPMLPPAARRLAGARTHPSNSNNLTRQLLFFFLA